MLLVSLAFLTVGYTLLYAGIKGGPGGQYARAPWVLWTQSFAQLSQEASDQRTFWTRFMTSVGAPPAG